MRAFYFSESPYPDAYGKSDTTLRVTFPNSHFDPVVGEKLINRYLDQWALADEIGLNIMVNEHHSSATSLNVSCMLPLAVMARETKNARLLAFGAPMGLRNDPVAVAEEFAWIDVVSGGRLEIGLVKGFGSEMAPLNRNPATADARFKEAVELLQKTLAHTGDPFSWEGDHFQYRLVNIWPRPLQQPSPPVWRSVASVFGANLAAEAGDNICAGSAGNARLAFDTYRTRLKELGKPAPSPDSFGYLTYISVGKDHDDAMRKLRYLLEDYEYRGLVAPQFNSPPGYLHYIPAAQALLSEGGRDHRFDRAGVPFEWRTAPLDKLVESGFCFAGDADEVFDQIREFYDYVGGFGTLLGQMHGGAMGYDDTTDTMRRFALDVLPRLQEYAAQ